MSGHSKWSTIKHKKAKTDSLRAAEFQKFSREIIVASKLGGPDPAGNFRLRTAIEKAKAADIPVIFFNRAVEGDEDEGKVLGSYDKCAFVGTDAPEAGHMQGEMIGNYVVEHFDEMDANHDGRITSAEITAYNVDSSKQEKMDEFANRRASDMSVFYGSESSSTSDSYSLLSYKYKNSSSS